ncbi:MAG: Hsp20/alpha crystallin family protein [bacterium]
MAEEDKKRSPEEQSDEGKENNKEEESAAGGILKGIGKMIPGLGGLIKNLEKSPAFKERLKEVDKELEHKIKSAPLKRTGGVNPMSGRFTRLRPRRGSSSGVRGKEPSPPPPQERPADIFDEQDHIKVIAEIPGVEDKDIKVNLQDNILIISVDIPNRKYHQELKLPCSPKGRLGKSYKNGILEIKIMKQ